MKLNYKTYVHGDKQYELTDQWLDDNGIAVSEKFRDRLARINYEIELVYEVDTDLETAKLIEVDGQRLL